MSKSFIKLAIVLKVVNGPCGVGNLNQSTNCAGGVKQQLPQGGYILCYHIMSIIFKILFNTYNTSLLCYSKLYINPSYKGVRAFDFRSPTLPLVQSAP